MSIVSIAKRYIASPNSNYITYANDNAYSYCLYDGNGTLYAATNHTVFTMPIISNTGTTQYAGDLNGGIMPGGITCNVVPYTINQFYNISAIAFDGSSNLYVADSGGVVQVFAPSGSTACNVVMTNVTTIAVNSAGTQVLGLSNNGSNLRIYSNSTSGTAPFNSSWTNTVNISITSGITSSATLSWLSYAPSLGTGGTFFTGSGGVSGDYIIQSVTSISGSGATFTPYSVDGVSTLFPAIVPNAYVYQILGASFDSSNNAYIITMPLGSQSNVNIGIRYITYTPSTTTFTSVTLGNPVQTKYTGYITTGASVGTLTLSTPTAPLPIAPRQYVTGPSVPAGTYIVGGSGQTAGSTWSVSPCNFSTGSSGAPVTLVNYANTIYMTGSNNNTPKPYLAGGSPSNPIFYVADGTRVREYITTY